MPNEFIKVKQLERKAVRHTPPSIFCPLTSWGSINKSKTFQITPTLEVHTVVAIRLPRPLAEEVPIARVPVERADAAAGDELMIA